MTIDVFKRIGDIKRIFHVRMGMIKNRNGEDITETEEVKKKQQEYTEELRKKKKTQNGLNDPDNHDGVVTHLEPDILECEVKWALGSITKQSQWM